MICILLLYKVLKFLSYRYTNFFNLFNLVSETHSKNIISKVLYADVLHTAPLRPQHKRAPLGEVGYKKINVEKASCLKRPVSMEEISLGL
jgi:hypothetical protein